MSENLQLTMKMEFLVGMSVELWSIKRTTEVQVELNRWAPQ
jgi:hypothetical protein